MKKMGAGISNMADISIGGKQINEENVGGGWEYLTGQTFPIVVNYYIKKMGQEYLTWQTFM